MYYRKRVFGSTAQWIAVALLLVLLFVIVVMITKDNKYNPLGAPVASSHPGGGVVIGVDSQPM